MRKLLQSVDCLVARLEWSLVLQKYLRNKLGVLFKELQTDLATSNLNKSSVSRIFNRKKCGFT